MERVPSGVKHSQTVAGIPKIDGTCGSFPVKALQVLDTAAGIILGIRRFIKFLQHEKERHETAYFGEWSSDS